MLYDTLIELPQEGKFSIKNSITEHTAYVYYIAEQHYEKEHRQSRNTQILIGKFNKEDLGNQTIQNRNGKPILFQPNKTFLETFDGTEFEEKFKQARQIKYLDWLFMIQTAKEIGLYEPLQKYFPNDFLAILALAFYFIVSEDTVADRFIDFHYDHYDGLKKVLTSQSISKFYERLADKIDEMTDFFDEFRHNFLQWMKDKGNQINQACIYITTQEEESDELDEQNEPGELEDDDQLEEFSLCEEMPEYQPIYDQDGSNWNTSSDKPDAARRGFSKSGSKKYKCIGQMRFTEHTSGVPLFTMTLDGNQLDRSGALWVSEQMDILDLAGPGLVIMDGGCYYKITLKKIKEAGHDYLLNVPLGTTEAKKILYMVEDELPNLNHYLVCHGLNGMSIPPEDPSGDYYYAFYKIFDYNQTLKAKIAEAEKQLRTILKRKRYDRLPEAPYLTITRKEKDEKGRDFHAEINMEAVEKACKEKNWFVFRSSREMTPTEALDLYRGRVPGIEESFRSEKSGFNSKVLRVHKQETYDGKRFVMDIAVILRQAMLFQLRPWMMLNPKMNLPKILSELERYPIRISKTGRVYPTRPMNRQQKDLLKTVRLTEGDVKKRLQRMLPWIKEK